MSPRTRARGSLHPVPLTQILVPLHHLLCSPAAPLSPPSMTHRSLSQCRPALTLTLNHVFYLGSRLHRACAVEGRCVGVVRGQAGPRLAATLFNRCWSSGAVPWAPKSRAVPENLRFHSRNVCQRPHTSALILLQSVQAYCTPSIRREKEEAQSWTASKWE